MEKTQFVQLLKHCYASIQNPRKLTDDGIEMIYAVYAPMIHEICKCNNVSISYKLNKLMLDFKTDYDLEVFCQDRIYNSKEPTNILITQMFLEQLLSDSLGFCSSVYQDLTSREIYLAICYYPRYFNPVKTSLPFYPLMCSDIIKQQVRIAFNNSNHNFQQVIIDYVLFIVAVWQSNGWEMLDHQIRQRNLPRHDPPLKQIEVLASSIIRDLKTKYYMMTETPDFTEKQFIHLLAMLNEH